VITIVLVDDHKVVRQGVKSLLSLESDFKVVGDADDGPEGLKLVQKLKPDILITDLKMNKMNGLEVVLESKKLSPDTRTIMLSMFGNGYVAKALKNGASGYIVKGSGIDEVVKAIRVVVNGEIYISPGLEKDN
jgi:two-component system response regulator DegU